MRFSRIKAGFFRLSTHNRLISIGAFLVVISVFMPWYEDLDQFRTGDMFLGITGPLYLAGFIILVAAATSLFLMSYKIKDKKMPELPMKESHMHIAAAGLNIFLLILVNSVYFHDKFGVNIALKESRFGMVVAFLGSVLLLIAAVMGERSGVSDFAANPGRLEPLIDMQNTRSQRDVREKELDEEPVYVDEHKEVVQSRVDSTLKRKAKMNDSKSSQPWRMDL